MQPFYITHMQQGPLELGTVKSSIRSKHNRNCVLPNIQCAACTSEARRLKMFNVYEVQLKRKAFKCPATSRTIDV